MIKFFKIKGTQIRKAYNINGERKDLVALIANVEESVKLNLIKRCKDYPYCKSDWIIINVNLINGKIGKGIEIKAKLDQFKSLSEAKEYIVCNWEKGEII